MNYVKNKLSSCFNPVVAEDEPRLHSTPSSDASQFRRRKISALYSLSGFMKAVFFKTPLLNKLRARRFKKPTKKEKAQTSHNKSVSDRDKKNRNRFYHSLSSSIDSSVYSKSISGYNRIKLASSVIPDSTKSMTLVSSKCDCRGLMFVVFICLVALAFWGKVFAIVTCMLAWLFLTPGRAMPRCGRIDPWPVRTRRSTRKG